MVTNEVVPAFFAVDDVVTRVAMNPVVALAATDNVVALLAVDFVAALEAQNQVIAIAPCKGPFKEPIPEVMAE